MSESVATVPQETFERAILNRLIPVQAIGNNAIDGDGNPSGGHVEFYPTENPDGAVAAFGWQDGPITEDNPVNGVTIEAVLDACVQRLTFLNDASHGKFRCRENSLAITAIEEAVGWLSKRRLDRLERGVLNSHTP